MMKNGEKDVFCNLRQLANLVWQWQATWTKLDISHTCLTPFEGQEAVILLLKLVLWGLRKFGSVCDRVRKNAEASRNCCVIYPKSKYLREPCLYKESWINKKTEKVWHLFVCPFILLLLLIMFIIIFFVCILILMGFHICYARYFWTNCTQ